MSDKKTLKAILKNDFYSYVQKVFYEITGGEPFIPNWHIEVLCHKLEQARLGEIKRLIINVPPRSLKSIIVNVAFSTWILGHTPSEKIISASYSSDLSEKFARDSKRVMESAWYRELFPKSIIAKDRGAANDLNTISRGGRFATSIEGTLTGRGGNFIIIDDPIKPSETMSENALNKVNEWYRNTLLSRLDNKEEGVIIVVMQRVHENDLTGYLLETPNHWTHVKIPQIATEDELWEVRDKVYRRKEGELLNPQQMDIKTIFELKHQMGTYVWSGQYQQEPYPSEGGIIREEWLRFYNTPPNDIVELYLSWDTGNKTGINNAYSACCVIGVSNKDEFYLLEVIRGKYEMWDLLQNMKDVYDCYTYDHNARGRIKLLIEDKASGTQAIQMLRAMRDRYGRNFDVVEINPNEDKVSRLRGVSALIESGNVRFPSDNPDWWKEFKKELIGFPGTKFKDQVDAFTQAITYPFKLLAER